MSRPLPRFTDRELHHDPLETMLAQREAQEQAARQAINQGNAGTLADPADLRGIPCIAHGVRGTQPGSSPHGQAALGHMDGHRLRRRSINITDYTPPDKPHDVTAIALNGMRLECGDPPPSTPM